MAAKLKKGDKVVVLSGKDKGKQGEISSVNPSAGKASCGRREYGYSSYKTISI